MLHKHKFFGLATIKKELPLYERRTVYWTLKETSMNECKFQVSTKKGKKFQIFVFYHIYLDCLAIPSILLLRSFWVRRAIRFSKYFTVCILIETLRPINTHPFFVFFLKSNELSDIWMGMEIMFSSQYQSQNIAVTQNIDFNSPSYISLWLLFLKNKFYLQFFDASVAFRMHRNR